MSRKLRRRADGPGNGPSAVDATHGGPPVGRPVTLRVVGSDDEQRNALTGEVLKQLEALDGVKDIERDDKPGKEQITVELDYIRLAENELSVADVAKNIRLAYDGEVVTSVRYGEEDVDFRVILEEEARGSAEVLADLRANPPRFIAWDHAAVRVDGLSDERVFGAELLGWIQESYEEEARLGSVEIMRPRRLVEPADP